jgi:hypothetical protein
MTTQKTLTPFTAAELELCFQVLNHSLAHPCHKCLELEALTDKVNFFRLKAKGLQENNITKVFPHGIKKKTTSKFEEASTDTAVVDIPRPASELLSRLEAASQVGTRTENKRKYTKSPKNNFLS